MSYNVDHVRLSPDQPGMTPAKVIQTYSDKEWEDFIGEWAEGFHPPYDQIVRLGGAGDLGRDIICHLEPATIRPRPCDIYQCKHYGQPLAPSDVYVELGKLCVFTERNDFPVPRHYRFVAPREVGPKLYNLLNNPESLRADLIANWDKYCRAEISKTTEFPLNKGLRTYIDNFDFSIVWYLTRAEILTQHQRTKHWHRRFKIEPPKRPTSECPPHEVQTHELPYVTRLLEAYADHLKVPVSIADLASLPAKILSNFSQSRGSFFIADSLARFSRDHFPGSFDEVKSHIFDGVVDVTHATHQDGFECLLAVMMQAAGLPLPSEDLTPYVGPADKKGVCHHLANDGMLTWVRRI